MEDIAPTFFKFLSDVHACFKEMTDNSIKKSSNKVNGSIEKCNRLFSSLVLRKFRRITKIAKSWLKPITWPYFSMYASEHNS